MKLTEFSIRNYGRLKDTGVINLNKQFALVKAEHGTGKTLMIDSLIKMMFGRRKRDGFGDDIDRVDDEPSGYLEIKQSDGNLVKMPENGRITDYNLSSMDFRNIFIIHGSDLFLDDEAPYYRTVSERIIGLRTSKISNIKQAVQDKFTLMPHRKDFRSAQDNNHLGDRLENIPGLLDKIDDLEKKIKSNGLENYEIEINKIRNSLEKINERRGKLNKARKGKDYKKGSKTLHSLKDSLKKLEDYKNFNEEDFEDFREACNKIKELEDKVSSLEEEIDDLKGDLSEKKDIHNEIKTELETLRDKKEKITEEIKPKLKNFEDLQKGFASKGEKRGLYNKVSLISSFFLGISLLGSLLSTGFMPFVYLFLPITAVSWILYARVKTSEGKLATKFEEVGIEASKVGIKGESKNEIYSEMDEFQTSFKQKETKERKISDRIQSLKSKIEEKNKALDERKDKIDDVRKMINKIKKKTSVNSLEDYQEKYKEKQKIEKNIGQCKRTLTTLFGSEATDSNYKERAEKLLTSTVKDLKEEIKDIHDSKLLDVLEDIESKKKNRKTALKAIQSRRENIPKNEDEPQLGKLIDYWNTELEKISEYEKVAEDIKFNEEKLDEVEKTREMREEEKEELMEQIGPIKEDLRDIEKEANHILNLKSDEKIPCETLTDLEEIRHRLKSFKDKKEEDLENALTAINIFDEIEKEEKEEVPKILRKASEHFSRITNGRFEEVKLDPSNMTLKVKEKDKKGFRLAKKLSATEKDQLYFSVRLVLAEELLKDEKGFFILDDPFVKLSPNALKTVFDTVRDMCKSGWQVIYFTAKGDVVDELSEDIKSDDIQEISVPGVK